MVFILATLPATGSLAGNTASPLPEAAMMKRLLLGPMRKFVPSGENQAIPKANLSDESGKSLSLADWRGRMVLVNLWATWCTPCRQEMRSLDNLQARLGGKDFDVIALNTDAGDATKIKTFYERFGVKHLATYLDSEKSAFKALRALGTPTSILIDCYGRELGRLAGAARWDSDEAVLLIRAMKRHTGCGGK